MGSVVPHDTIELPSTASLVQSGTTTSTTADKLVDTGGDFVNKGVAIGDTVYNPTDTTAALVTAIDSATTLSVDADIFASGEEYEIFNKVTAGSLLYVGATGATGSLTVTSIGGQTKTFVGLIGGTFLPVQVKQVWSTGTTTTDLIAIS